MAIRGRIIAAIAVLIVLGLIVMMVMKVKKDEVPFVGPSPGPSSEDEDEDLFVGPSPGPCDEYDDNTPASEVSVECLRKTLTDLGCSSSGTLYNSISDDYAGWFKTDGDSGAGTFIGIRAGIEDYVNSDDEVKREECLGAQN